MGGWVRGGVKVHTNMCPKACPKACLCYVPHDHLQVVGAEKSSGAVRAEQNTYERGGRGGGGGGGGGGAGGAGGGGGGEID